MRNEFAKTLTELAEHNKDLVLLTGDIGNKLFDNFKEKYPDRFYNCGVAEANMTGVASGLASSGLRPITYTITPFNTARCFEQIRLDVCYPNLPVIIVGTGSGLSYASLGATHHSMEDISILRTLPNLQIVCPADKKEVKASIVEALKSNKPTYIRLGKKGEPEIHKKIPKLKIGKGLILKKGKDLAILGVHGLIGGAGSAVLEWANLNKKDASKVIRFGGPDKFLTGCGNQKEARKLIGLESKKIVLKILEHLKK